MAEIISAKRAVALGYKKVEGRGSFSATADTQYYTWYSPEGELVGYSFYNYRTAGQGSGTVVLDAARAARFVKARR